MIRVSWEGNPFESMSVRDLEIFNLLMNLMAMPEDHPNFKADMEKLEKLLEDSA